MSRRAYYRKKRVHIHFGLFTWEFIDYSYSYLKTFKAIFYSSSQLVILAKTVEFSPMNRNCLKSLGIANQLKTSGKVFHRTNCSQLSPPTLFLCNTFPSVFNYYLKQRIQLCYHGSCLVPKLIVLKELFLKTYLTSLGRTTFFSKSVIHV